MFEDLPSYQSDLIALEANTNMIELVAGDARMAVAPEHQGRVMTATGRFGQSFGWINHRVLREGPLSPAFNALGGADRFWIGPEGSRFALFFDKEVPMSPDTWRTPRAIDREPWVVTSRDASSVTLMHAFQVRNRASFAFDIRAERTVRILDRQSLSRILGEPLPSELEVVGFETDNAIVNAGREPWRAERGLVSIWILGMFPATDDTTVVIPIKSGTTSDLGPAVNGAYYGQVPPERLKNTSTAVFFRADARWRSKIGISPRRALGVAGSYAPSRSLLTIVQYDRAEATAAYPYSQWSDEASAYDGDVFNSYNDGPTAEGGQFGRFFELESSSPVRALAPGERLAHRHRTIFLAGSAAALDPFARRQLGVSTSAIKEALPQ